MIRIPDTPLDPIADAALRLYQVELDALASYPERVEAAAKRFETRNRESNKTFTVVW